MNEVLSSFVKDLPAWMLVALGFYIAFRVLQYPDLTVDASFIAGTVGTAAIAIHFHSSSWGLVLALGLSAFAGTMTGLIYLSNPRPAYKLLSGVLVYLSFYSVNYRVLGRKTYNQFSDLPTFMNHIADFESTHGLWDYRPLTVGLGFAVVAGLFFFFRWFFKTALGLRVRSVGSRPYLVSYSRGPVGQYVVLGLILSNMTVGVGGWFYGSLNGFTDINVFGTILHALAAAIIGELIVERLPCLRDRRTSITTVLIAPLVGALIYIFCRALVTWFILEEVQGIDPNSYNLSTQDVNAVIAIVIICAIMALRFISQQWQEPVLLTSGGEEGV